MYAAAAASSTTAAYGGGGSHWSDSGTHIGGGGNNGDHDDANAAAAVAATDVFRDFTWYSAMLLSHLFALEHAQLVREAVAEEARRRANASAHSPQLLIRAAVAAANAPNTCVAPPLPAEEVDGTSKSENRAAATATSADSAETPWLSHLTAQHRPHILLGFTVHSTTAGNTNHNSSSSSRSGSEESLLSDPATRWMAPARADEIAGGCTATTSAAETGATTALLAVFDAFYFPTELFPSPANTPGTSSAAATTGGDIINNSSDCSAGGPASTSAVPLTMSDENARAGDGGEGGDVAGMSLRAAGSAVATGDGVAVAAGGSAAGAAAGAPCVTPEALRDAFHALLLLGQRCAAFALTFHGIIGSAHMDPASGEEAEASAPMAVPYSADNNPYPSSENESRSTRGGDGGGGGGDRTGDAAMQQAASATLQFLLRLACNCPCAPLSYAAQLCLAHTLAVQPPPCSAAGWTARQQLLRYLPTLQPPSRALTAETSAAGSHHHSSAVSAALANSSATTTANTVSPPAGGGFSSGSSSGNASNRVPATQYVRAEDPMLWFDTAGTVHVTTAQRWWERQQQQQQRSRAAVLSAFCGPLPATTALPTVQRLLMEEDQYMGPNGSAAAVLQSVLEAVSTEVTLNARVIPGSSSSLVHTGVRRRRGMHGGSSSTAELSSSQRRATAGGVSSASPNPPDASLESEGGGSGGGQRSGPATLPCPSSTVVDHSTTSATSSAVSRAEGTTTTMTTTTAAAAAAVSASSRLSKAAKRRRALLFALAQSHLLPPTPQLTTSKALLYGVFTDDGECPSYYMLLSLYPDILRAHHAALRYVLFEEGPLSVDVRLMVATMAASRHRCEYLVSRFSALLLRYAEEAMLEDGQDDEDAMRLAYDLTDDYNDNVYRGGGGGGGGHVGRRGGVQNPLYDPHGFSTDDEAGPYHHGDMRHAPPQQQQQQQLPCRGQTRRRWIVHGPPLRLRAVRHFIAIAAHTPWTLNEHDIRGVLAAGWTIPEIFQLAAIVAQVVPLCSFVMGMFVPAEPWTMTLLPLEVVERLGHRAVAEENAAAGVTASGAGGSGGGGDGMVSSGSSGALSGLRRSSNLPGDAMSGACPGPSTPHQATPSRSLLGAAMSGSDATTQMTSGGSNHNLAGLTPSSAATMMTTGGGVGGGASSAVDVYRRYAGEDNIVSEQRIKGSSTTANPHTLWRSQFTWNEVGATSMEQYYPGAATLLSEEMECFFDVVRQLTKADCVGLMSPDYTPSYAFRSLQLYVQNLLGFMVEDYPYNDINKVLRRPAKWFAQVLTMRPETLTRSEVVRWYVPTTPPIGKSSDMSAESSLVTHQLKREIELLSVVDSAQGGHRGGIESASAHPDVVDNPPPTPAEAARDAAEAAALQSALTLQDERVLLLIALATMEARKEGLLHILLRPICTVLNNM